MMSKKMMFLVPGMLLGLGVVAAEAAGAVPAIEAADHTVQQVDVARQEILQQCNVKVEEANKCMANGDYDKALRLLREVWDLVNERKGDQFSYITKSCEKKIKRCYYLKAQAAMKKADASAAAGDFEAAVKLCREIQEFYPEDKEKVAKKISFYEKRRNAAILREESSMEKLDPGKDLQDYQIEVLLEQGRVLAKRNDLLKARRCFEEVLLLDPYNDAALQDLLGTNDRIRSSAKVRADNTARHMTGQVEWAGTIPILPDAPADVTDNQIASPVEKVQNNELEEKLKAIIIPSLEMEDMTFKEAMELLVSACRQNDPAHKGVNFIIKEKERNISSIGKNQGEELNAPDFPNAQNAPNGQEAMDDEGAKEKLKEFIRKRVSVYDALLGLRARGDLSFKITRNAVYVAAAGVPLEGMVVKTFPSDVADSMDPKTLTEQITASSGVTFPPGAYVIPQPNHVVVRHTPENLKKIEAALQSINNEPEEMVQLMFKFIEVTQKDLDELAFSWQYARVDSHVTFQAGNGNMLRHYYPGDQDSYGGTAEAARWTAQEGAAQPYTADPDATYNFTWQDGQNKLNFSVYALDWADSSDVLYSPRVTTLSGQTAKVDMSEKHYYPSEWETIDSESNANYTVWVEGAQPTLDDEQDLGIKFEVTPEVSDRQIHVPLDIPIKTFYDWLVVDTTIDPKVMGTDSGESDDGEFIKKPIFNKRSIKTDVTVKDGETVLIGSISNDVAKSILDKIPILGDIPLLGRFFQSRYTSSEKSNLLIFMTCRIIKPDGTAKYPDDIMEEGSVPFTHR